MEEKKKKNKNTTSAANGGAASASGIDLTQSAERELDRIVEDATDALLKAAANVDPDSPARNPQNIRAHLLQRIKDEIDIENSVKPKDDKIAKPQRLPRTAVRKLVIALHTVVNVIVSSTKEGDAKVLAIYQTSGSKEGIYDTDEATLLNLIDSYAPGMTRREKLDTLADLENMAPVRRRNTDRDLIAVNNGVFDYRTKTLLPFSPDLVFTSKCNVDYVANAANPVIHNPDGTLWDVESWFCDLSDDQDVVDLLWQGLGAVVRPLVAWDKVLSPYGDGCNGKGTYCELAENLCGSSCTDIPLANFGKDFHLGELLVKSVVICHENDTNSFLRDVKYFKSAVTGDTFQLNRKNKAVLSIRFNGFMMQCFNDMPRINDRSSAIYRRFLWVPFWKDFKGCDRSYIKDDYIHRKEVLEYVLCKVLNMPDYYKLSEPAACKSMLEEFKVFNDPLRQFWGDFAENFVWQLLPMQFLYDLYKKWFEKNCPSGGVQGRNTFMGDLKSLMAGDPEWEFCAEARPGHMMDASEPLILEYDLKDWMAKGYTGSDPVKKCMTSLASKYKNCLRRRSAAAAGIAVEKKGEIS